MAEEEGEAATPAAEVVGEATWAAVVEVLEAGAAEEGVDSKLYNAMNAWL